MAANIEAKIQSLHGFPINDEITSDYEEYQLWFIANFEEQIIETDGSNREFNSHVDRLAYLSNESHKNALQLIRDTYLTYLHKKSSRLSVIVQELHTDQFAGFYLSACSYLEKLNEAMTDHLGLDPESITETNVNSMQKINSHLTEINGLLRPYGYGDE